MENSYKLLLLYSPMANGKWQVTCPVLTELAFEADAWSEIKPMLKKEFGRILEERTKLNLPIPDIMKRINTSEPFMIDMLIPVQGR